MHNEMITIENFINFCDDMMIANEGKLLDKIKNRIKAKRDKRSGNSKNASHNQLEDVNETERDNIMKKMQSDCINYLKSYVSKSDFKSKYKDFLYLIKIVPETYGDPYSVEICEDQDGIDYDRVNKWLDKHKSEYDDEDDAWDACPYAKNHWYNELLDAGEKYLKEKYKDELKKYRLHINTGDGDECNIYILIN